MSKISKLLKKHEQEIAELRATCLHEKRSDWLDLLDGRTIVGNVKVCEECGERLESELY